MKRAIGYAAMMMVLCVLCTLVGCGRPGGAVGDADERKEPVPFNPTVALRLRALPESEGEEDIPQLRAAIEEMIKEKKRVKLVEDPATADVLIDIPFYLKKAFNDSGWYYRLQFIDVPNDVVIYEDGHSYTGNMEDPKDLLKAATFEFKYTTQWLEKHISVSSQIEKGKDGVTYLETSPWKNDRITYGRRDLGKPGYKAYVDYNVRAQQNTLDGAALNLIVNQLYKQLMQNKVSVVDSPEKADVVFRVSNSSGGGTSYSRVIGGTTVPAATNSGAALGARIEVFRKGQTEPAHVMIAEGKAPGGSTFEAPESLSLQSLESALGSKLGELQPYFKH